MPKKKSRKPPAEGRLVPAAATAATPAARDFGGAIAAALLVLALAFAGLAVDSGADASFDAPKRLTVLACTAAAALAAFGFSRWKSPWRRPPAGWSFAEGAAAAGACLAALLLVSALASPRRSLALDATRALFLAALALPLGASRALAGRRRIVLLAAFLAVVSANVAVSFLQARDLYHPFPLITRGSRESTGAFVGNPGSLALTISLCSVSCLAFALFARRPWPRAAAAAGAAAFAGGLLVNRNLTSLTALVTGSGILLLARFGRRAALPILAMLFCVGAGILAYRPMRQRTSETLSALREGDWDRFVTYRLGPWAAAFEMARERPWLGWGPGTYAAEFVPHRLRADIELRRRMTNPLLTGSYAEAHCDYLQVFAEAGLPAGLALFAGITLLFRGLLAAARSEDPARPRTEVILLVALLGAGAVAALTWFPMQRPISSIPLLLAAGRAWRIMEPSEGAP
jgi:O-antigen ligase